MPTANTISPIATPFVARGCDFSKYFITKHRLIIMNGMLAK